VPVHASGRSRPREALSATWASTRWCSSSSHQRRRAPERMDMLAKTILEPAAPPLTGHARPRLARG
jgi:hypothetical protein